MILIKVNGTKIIRTIKSDDVAEIEAYKVEDNTLIEVPDFNFSESMDLYEYVNDTIQLVNGWELIKQDRYIATLPSRLEAEKTAKIALIKSTTDVTTPVPVGVITYSGGDASASAIKGAIDFANIKNETEVGIWDINDVVTIMPLASAMDVVIAIGEAYRTTMYARQARIAAVNAIEIDPLGTYPTYEDAAIALDLI